MFFLLLACAGDAPTKMSSDTDTTTEADVDTDTDTDTDTDSDTDTDTDTTPEIAWSKLCPESLTDPWDIRSGSDAWDGFAWASVNTALHVMSVYSVISEGEETGCPALSSVGSGTTRIDGDCKNKFGSSFTGWLEVTSTSTEYSQEGELVVDLRWGSASSYAFDGTLAELSGSDGSLDISMDATFSVSGSGTMYKRVTFRSAPTTDGFEDVGSGYVSVTSAATGGTGDFCVLLDLRSDGSCANELDGGVYVLGAQEAWLESSQADCDGCMSVTIDGAASDDYCR